MIFVYHVQCRVSTQYIINLSSELCNTRIMKYFFFYVRLYKYILFDSKRGPITTNEVCIR